MRATRNPTDGDAGVRNSSIRLLAARHASPALREPTPPAEAPREHRSGAHQAPRHRTNFTAIAICTARILGAGASAITTAVAAATVAADVHIGRLHAGQELR